MPTLELNKTARPHFFFSPRRPWMYVSILGTAGLLLLINFAAMPLVVQGYTTSIDPIVPKAEPGLATSNLLKALNAQNLGVENLGRVAHPYLAGRGTIFAFANDNIQIFEYPTSEMASKEASAIFERSPRLTTLDYFRLYLQGNLIGLYFGYNAEVLKITEEKMGPPIQALPNVIANPTY